MGSTQEIGVWTEENKLWQKGEVEGEVAWVIAATICSTGRIYFYRYNLLQNKVFSKIREKENDVAEIWPLFVSSKDRSVCKRSSVKMSLYGADAPNWYAWKLIAEQRKNVYTKDLQVEKHGCLFPGSDIYILSFFLHEPIHSIKREAIEKEERRLYTERKFLVKSVRNNRILLKNDRI